MINGLFDIEFRMEDLTRNGDPLVRLNECVDFEVFRLELETIREKERKSPAGRKPFDVVLMFKVLVLQSLYNLSDYAVEYQVRDRLSFMRFLGLTIGDRVPDAKTIWLFREELGRAGLVKRLFKRFDRYLREQGFTARKGCRNRKLTDWEKRGNRTRSRVRCRIEHVFGIQAQMAGNLILRTIGKVRAEVKIGLRNLAYNIHRLGRCMPVTG